MKRFEVILSDAEYKAYRKISIQQCRTLNLQTQFLINCFLKTSGVKILKTRRNIKKHKKK